jgi:uncharacterized protein
VNAPGRQKAATGPWVKLALAAVAWVAAYQINDPFWTWLVHDVAGMDLATRLGSGVHFFFYDTVKIALLLTGIIFLVTVLRSFMSVERTRALLGGRHEGVGNILAACLGVITQFCSCSAVPAFISPLINEVAIALLLGLFGPGPTALYIGAGLLIAIVAGLVLGRLHLEKWVEPFVFETRLHGQLIDPSAGLTWEQRIAMGAEEVRTILAKIWPYLLVGIGVGAAIHGWAPEDFFARHAGADNPFAVLIAVVIGVPLYSNAAGILPLVEALHDKGLPMGTLLAFMMATVALSLPETILLKRVLKPPLIAAFIAVTATGIIAVGYLFNAVLPA